MLAYAKMVYTRDLKSLFYLTDIDECTTNNQAERDQCSQLCVNTEGSYICQCHDGYRLSADGRSCEGE